MVLGGTYVHGKEREREGERERVLELILVYTTGVVAYSKGNRK